METVPNNMERSSPLDGIEGPIPGNVMMESYRRAGQEERARREIEAMGIVIGPEEKKTSYIEILEFVRSKEA